MRQKSSPFEYVSMLACATFLSTVVLAQAARPEDGGQLAIANSALGFGYSTGKLLWVAASQPQLPQGVPPNVYSKLAIDVRKRIDEGRAAAGVVGAHFDLMQSTLTYVALSDPEPMTKVTAGLVAFGAKKTGEFLVSEMVRQTEKGAVGMVEAVLKADTRSDSELRAMSPEKAGQDLADFKLAGEQMSKIIDDPALLGVMQEHYVDIVSGNSLEALRRADKASMGVDEVRQTAQKTREDVADMREKLEARAEGIEEKIGLIDEAVTENTNRLDDLDASVKDNTEAISAVAQISFSGWTTEQKLQAAREDLVPGLSDIQKKDLVASLDAERKQEKLVGNLSSATGDLKDIAEIAQHLNVPPEMVDAVNKAQVLVGGATKFAQGDYLGAISSATSLIGMGHPDPSAVQHQQMMKYLAEQFAEINGRLVHITELQKETLANLETLRKEQEAFRADVDSRLGRIESVTLASNRMLQALVRGPWLGCEALVNNPIFNGATNGEFRISSREQLMSMLANGQVRGYAASCYHQMTEFLDSSLLAFNWSGQYVSADVADKSPENDATQTETRELTSIDNYAYVTASALILGSLNKEDLTLRRAGIVARVAQPVGTARGQAAIVADFGGAAGSFSGFDCDHRSAISPALGKLLCFEPDKDRLGTIFRSAMLGPQAMRVVNEGLLLATFGDLSSRLHGEKDIELVEASDLNTLVSTGAMSERLIQAQRDQNGLMLLENLRVFAEAIVVQQSVAYGDYTAQLAEEALYDPATRTLNTSPSSSLAAVRATLALAAMRGNPVLARNVVLLALRHAIADTLGGRAEAERVDYLPTRYRWSYENFLDGDRCGDDPIAKSEWNAFLPGWAIQYVTTPAERQAKQFANCPSAQTLVLGDVSKPDLGSGLSVKVGDFYVKLPNFMELSIGKFEQPASLLQALALRDKVNQAIVDRHIGEDVAAVGDGVSGPLTEQIAHDILNEVSIAGK